MNLFHSDVMRALPPFDALIAFESALRHRSMTRAAGELGLTQSAISHRLRRLEGFMGTPLLERQNGSLAATTAGAALAEGLAALLDDMAQLRARSRAAVAPAALKVGVGSALADYWLVRRLPGFAAAYPKIPVELTVVESEKQARGHDLDLQILWRPAATARASSTERLLFREHVFPVSAPALLPRGKPLRDAKALARLPLLHKGSAANGGAEWSWPAWFERLGLGAAPSGLRFDTIGTTIAAALQGAGVVLARSLLVHDALADGRLSRVLPAKWDMPSSKAHVVRWPAALAGDARVRAFVDWLSHETRSTAA
jgi:LysR family transcriptional regulator, glycine cleavage system transcriptional activator